jgi:hypothetical protein
MIQYEKPYETTMERIRREKREEAEAYKVMERRSRIRRWELIGFTVLAPTIFFVMLALYALFAPVRP